MTARRRQGRAPPARPPALADPQDHRLRRPPGPIASASATPTAAHATATAPIRNCLTTPSASQTAVSRASAITTSASRATAAASPTTNRRRTRTAAHAGGPTHAARTTHPSAYRLTPTISDHPSGPVRASHLSLLPQRRVARAHRRHILAAAQVQFRNDGEPYEAAI